MWQMMKHRTKVFRYGMMHLYRELVQDTKSPVFIATPFTDSLDEIAEEAFRASSNDIADLGFAIAKNT